MIFYLVGGEIKFLTHKVEYIQGNEQREMSFYDVEKKDALLARLAEREITPTITEHEQPSAELLAKCEGKTFNTYQEAVDFINTGIEKITLESLAEIVADIIGGAI